MFAFGFAVAGFAYWLCQLVLPSNILMRWLRRPSMRAWAPLVSPGLAVVYAVLTYLVAWAGEDLTHWLVIPAIACMMSCLKFIVFTPIAVIRLIADRIRSLMRRHTWSVREVVAPPSPTGESVRR